VYKTKAVIIFIMQVIENTPCSLRSIILLGSRNLR